MVKRPWWGLCTIDRGRSVLLQRARQRCAAASRHGRQTRDSRHCRRLHAPASQAVVSGRARHTSTHPSFHTPLGCIRASRAPSQAGAHTEITVHRQAMATHLSRNKCLDASRCAQRGGHTHALRPKLTWQRRDEGALRAEAQGLFAYACCLRGAPPHEPTQQGELHQRPRARCRMITRSVCASLERRGLRHNQPALRVDLWSTRIAHDLLRVPAPHCPHSLRDQPPPVRAHLPRTLKRCPPSS